MMMGTQLCSSRVLSLPRDECGDEELSVLPRHTKVIVTGNNRTKSVLVGLQGVVKKAVGLGGWHWLVLKNGVEVKLQRNALSILEAPTGNEDDDDIDGNNSFCSSSDMGEKDMDYASIECRKPTKPRVRHTRPWSCTKSSNRGTFHPNLKLQAKVNLTKLGTPTLEILEALQPCMHEPQSIKGGALPWGTAAFPVTAIGRVAGHPGLHSQSKAVEEPVQQLLVPSSAAQIHTSHLLGGTVSNLDVHVSGHWEKRVLG
ncbi:unnamed protein product [Urochloa humidicola]